MKIEINPNDKYFTVPFMINCPEWIDLVAWPCANNSPMIYVYKVKQ